MGNSQKINVEEDRQILKSLPDTEIKFIVEPSRQELQELLWDEIGWDLICFSGHSHSQADGSTGVIHIIGVVYLQDGQPLMCSPVEINLIFPLNSPSNLQVFNDVLSHPGNYCH